MTPKARIVAPRLTSGDLTPQGRREALALCERAEPVARAIVRNRETLAGPGTDTLDAFIVAEDARARCATPDPLDPNHETTRATARADAYYTVGLCVGVLLAGNR